MIMQNSTENLVIGGTYRHYKDKLYRVLGVAKHSETREELVVYETLYDSPGGRLWVRPKAMFTETVTIGDYHGPRFRHEAQDGR